MKPAPFAHHAPSTIADAVALLDRLGSDAKVLAGGQSLIPMLSMRLASPAHLIDINRLPGLDAITIDDDWVRIGALVRHAQLEASDDAYAALPLLRQALRNVAHPAIRNRGTTVGSLVHADAAGEMPAVLALTDGVIEAVGPQGNRDISSSEFFLGALETALRPDEFAAGARFHRFPAGTLTGFAESARRSGDYAIAGVAFALTVVDQGVVGARAAYVSVTEVPRVLELTDLLRGSLAAVDEAMADVVAAVHDFVDPESDIHASADYRRMLAGELTRRLVLDLVREAA